MPDWLLVMPPLFPFFSSHDQSNHRLRDAKYGGECCLCIITGGPNAPDFANAVPFKFLTTSVFLSLARHVPTFRHFIVGIIPMRSYEQMSRIHARRIVASVADAKTGRNSPIVHPIGNSMGSPHMSAKSEESISLTAHGCSPHPAAFGMGRLVNLLPEVFELPFGEYLNRTIFSGGHSYFMPIVRAFEPLIRLLRSPNFVSELGSA